MFFSVPPSSVRTTAQPVRQGWLTSSHSKSRLVLPHSNSLVKKLYSRHFSYLYPKGALKKLEDNFLRRHIWFFCVNFSHSKWLLSVKTFQLVKILAQYQTSLEFYSGSSGWRGKSCKDNILHRNTVLHLSVSLVTLSLFPL